MHYTYEKSLIERVNQYLKDRTKGFDYYYSCRKQGCNLSHVKRWLNPFCCMYNEMRRNIRFNGLLNLMEVSLQVKTTRKKLVSPAETSFGLVKTMRIRRLFI